MGCGASGAHRSAELPRSLSNGLGRAGTPKRRSSCLSCSSPGGSGPAIRKPSSGWSVCSLKPNLQTTRLTFSRRSASPSYSMIRTNPTGSVKSVSCGTLWRWRGRLGEPERIAHTSWAFAELQLAWGDTRQARSLLDDALALREKSVFVSSIGIGWCHNSLGWVAVAEHDYPRACAELARRPPSLLGLMKGASGWPPTPLPALGPLTVAAGDPDRGLRLAEEALVRARQPWLRAVLIMALASGAETAILSGNHDRAPRAARGTSSSLARPGKPPVGRRRPGTRGRLPRGRTPGHGCRRPRFGSSATRLRRPTRRHPTGRS